MSREIAGQLDIFAELDLIAAAERRQHEQDSGVPTLFASPSRGLRARQVEYERWTATWGRCASIGVSHAWTIAPCCPDTPTRQCQPTVLSADLRCDCTARHCHCVGDLLYKGACCGCEWESAIARDDESDAATDALDHAHPGWRADPVLECGPIPEAPRQRKHWIARVEQLRGPRPNGWPMITARTSGTRAVSGRSPWGGYDIAAKYAHKHTELRFPLVDLSVHRRYKKQ